MLEFLGSDPAGGTEWRCTACELAFKLWFDDENDAISRDPTHCPYCGVVDVNPLDKR